MAPAVDFCRALTMAMFERRPAPVFFVPAGPLLARVVQQPLRDIFPDGAAAKEADSVHGLNFHVRSQRRQETRSTWCWISESFRCRIRTPSLARGSWSNDSQYSAGSASSAAGAGTAGLRAASAASFSICLAVGMRQLAGRSVMPRLEHNKNKCRVPLRVGVEKNDPTDRQRTVGTNAPRFVLNPASVLEFPAMAPRANWKGFLRLSLVTCPVALYPATSEVREDLLQPAQPTDRPSHQIHEGGRRHRRGSPQRGHRQGLRARQGHLHRGDARRSSRRSRWNRRAPSRSTSSWRSPRSIRAT